MKMHRSIFFIFVHPTNLPCICVTKIGSYGCYLKFQWQGRWRHWMLWRMHLKQVCNYVIIVKHQRQTSNLHKDEHIKVLIKKNNVIYVYCNNGPRINLFSSPLLVRGLGSEPSASMSFPCKQYFNIKTVV